MAAKDLGPLDWRTPIVDGAGRPSPEFQRRWNTQRGNNGLIGSVTLGSGAPTGTPSDGDEFVDTSTTPFTVYIGSGGSWHKAGVVVFTDLSDAPHSYTGAGLALVRVKSTANGVEFVTPSAMLDGFGTPAAGQLLQRGASTWGLVTLSAVLDGISSTRGSVLYRGASGWAALGPGTAGQVLQTGGAGADPSWVAQSGGGVNRAFSAFTSVGTPATATETTLQSYTLPGGTIGTNGQALRICAAGSYAATTRSRTARLYFGATVVALNSNVTGSTVTQWGLEAVVLLQGPATQMSTGVVYNNAPITIFGRTAASENLAGNVVIKVTGQSATGAVAGDVTCDFLIVEVLP